MNRNLIKTMAITLVLSSATTLMPNVLNLGTLGTTAVYAASTSGYITDISLETNKGKTVNVYTKSSYSSKYKLSKISGKAPTKLYAQVASNVSKVKVSDVDFGTDCDNIKIYKGSTEIALNEEVKISSSLTLKIKAYSGTTLKETYTLEIKKESSSSNKSNDDVYLDDLSLTYDNDDINFNFDKDTSTYNINVKNKTSYIKVFAEPEDDDYSVKINGSSVTSSSDWAKKVSLSEGKNTITVKIKDDDSNTRDYTLNITREAANTSGGTNTNNGTALKEGWQLVSGDWYFVGPDGSKQTGWQKIDGRWYYMDDSGIMKTGWLKSPYSGKWYYLNPISNGFKGAMLTNTIIDGYRIGLDGARIN
ncbi:hypothetical protein GKZ28_20965 [Clostridium chromiireducens]|uniref:Cadherin-like beta-sandwich-like domain-containing protein n=1 Tax=Clostridium chromiireducens TaxID=225345 RepID=A0A964W441_9CLOT|nr:cadherin-like beta sandwich domain-containing protein [Clostridium chromiireducens]MVX66156.1 hypothetical protein [Clostridium chromiireducens]